MRIWDAGTYETEKWERGQGRDPLPRRARERPLRALSHPRQGLDDPPHGPARAGRAAAGAARADARHARADAERPGPLGVRDRLARRAGDRALRHRAPDAARRARATTCARCSRSCSRSRSSSAAAGRARRRDRRCSARTARPSAERLERRLGASSDSEIRRRRTQTPATLIIFDLLHAGPREPARAPLHRAPRAARGARRSTATRGGRPPITAGEGDALREAARRQGLAGVVAKRLDSIYRPGRAEPRLARDAGPQTSLSDFSRKVWSTPIASATTSPR